MQNLFVRTAATALMFATLATPALADDGNRGDKDRGGRGWGAVMASFRVEKEGLKAEIKAARQEFKAERKEDRRGRKPKESESSICLEAAKANRETALTAARKSYNAALEAAKATNAASVTAAKNVRIGAYASAQATFLASDKSLSAHIALLTAKSKAMSDWRSSVATSQTVMINAKTAVKKAFDEAKLKIEIDYKTVADKCVTVATDVTAPAAISTLTLSGATTTGMTATWTATGDDGSTGTAASYDLRYSTAPITDANFAAASQVSGEPSAAVSGTVRAMVVGGLTNNVTYYFAVKSVDEAGNVSALSNVPSITTLP